MPRSLLFVLLLLLPGGCGSILNPYEENFKCRTPDDSGACVDVAAAYGHATGLVSLAEGDGNSTGVPGSREAYQEAQYDRLAALLEQPETPLLTPPKVMRGLILAYPGTGSELFMPRYIYFKVEDGKWVLGEDKRHLLEAGK